MDLKKIKIINVIFLFAISFLWHFMYDLIPSNIVAIFFPVNESIWEHMKIIYGVFVIGIILEVVLCKKFHISINNIYIELVAKSFLGVIFYLVIFIPLYLLLGENMFISISLMLITYILMEFIGYKINMSKELNIKVLPIIVLVLGFALFGVLTFYPRHNFLFFDETNMAYGIIK